jgi:hypothetical protein
VKPEPAIVMVVAPLPAEILAGETDVTVGAVGVVGGAGLVGLVTDVEDPPQPKDRKATRAEETTRNGRKRSPSIKAQKKIDVAEQRV